MTALTRWGTDVCAVAGTFDIEARSSRLIAVFQECQVLGDHYVMIELMIFSTIANTEVGKILICLPVTGCDRFGRMVVQCLACGNQYKADEISTHLTYLDDKSASCWWTLVTSTAHIV